ncbi:MAG: EAL domain-containing protein [Gammaproteobacteria bacterium]|nr:EAL domain-containing protein [Gammaproteobacteria bacterium]
MHDMSVKLADEIYISALNSLGEGVIILDLKGRVLFINQQAREILGWDCEELYGMPLHEMIHYQKANGSDYPLDECATYRSLSTGTLQRHSDDVFTHKDGHIIPVSHVTTPIIENGQHVGLTVAFHDITERKRGEAASKLQSTALAAAANAIFITDNNGSIEWVNKAFEKMTGYTSAEVLGRNPRLLNSGIHSREFFTRIWDEILAGKVWRGEVVERHRSGVLYTVEQTITPMIEDGHCSHFVVIHEDVSERKQAEEKIRYMALYDSLTGLPNREMLIDRMHQALAIAERHECLFAVMFLDLDHFKDINDSLGHPIGDKLLQGVAKRLQACVRASDTVIRFGGDEFVILQTDLSHVDGSVILAKKIISALNKPFYFDGHEVLTSTSIGIALFPFDDSDEEQLLKHADMAMYQAKAQGRNNYQFFDASMHQEVEERIFLEKSLRQALRRQEFELVYQPQIAAASGELIGMEALIRWNHPQRGLISPAEFIPLAESSGLILGIGEWVLHTACQQARIWHQQGLDHFRVAVNLSVVQLRESDLVSAVTRILDETGLEGQYLELELTESMLMDDVDHAVDTLKRLNKLGVNLAIDDFGTGYSSLSYLSQLPVQRVKLDQSFVRNITSNSDSAAIAHAVMQLGHSLGLDVLAEGVESEEQMQYLEQLGCDALQGYYFSAPLPPEGFEYFVSKGHWWQNRQIQ